MKIITIMKLIVYCQLVLFFFVISCRDNDNLNRHSVIDTVERPLLIPYKEDSSITGSRTELFLQKLGQQMGLQPISSKTSGLYIRIWLWYPDSNYVLNIIDDSVGKNCNVMLFDSEKDTVDMIRIWKRWPNIYPRSGWDKLLTMINNYGILEKNGGRSYEEMKQTLTMMTYVQFEIVHAGRYRFYEYLEPSFYRTVDSSSNDTYEFLNYLKHEIGISIYDPDELVADPKYPI